MKSRRALFLVLLLLVLLVLTGCGQIHEVGDVLPVETIRTVIQPISIIAENTATPEPVITVRDPLKSHSAIRVKMDVPSGVEIPAFYQPIDLDGVDYVVFAFQNASNKTVYRVYGEVDELEDQHAVNTLKGFFEANVSHDGNSFYVYANKDQNPINISSEMPGNVRVCRPPTKNNINNYVRNMDNARKKYEQAVANADKKGEPRPEPTPWDELPILTADTPYMTFPGHVRSVKKVDNLFSYVNIYGDNEYRLYGSMDGVDSGFYLADADGNVKPGALKIDYSIDFDKANAKSGRAKERPSDNLYRLPVYITLNDNSVSTVYTIYYK